MDRIGGYRLRLSQSYQFPGGGAGRGTQCKSSRYARVPKARAYCRITRPLNTFWCSPSLTVTLPLTITASIPSA